MDRAAAEEAQPQRVMEQEKERETGSECSAGHELTD